MKQIIARTIAKRFNATYNKDVFKVPEAYILKQSARIMSLQDPMKKMSKSDENPNGSIFLLDSRDTIIKKFKRAVTDSENMIRYSESQPGIMNLINIYSCVTDKTPADVEKEFDGAGYGTFKEAVGEAVADKLSKIQDKYAELDLPENNDLLKSIYEKGAERAHELASAKLKEVYDAVGFILK